MSKIYHTVLSQIRSGSRIVLATVVRTAGSTPQKPGSSAVFNENGLLAGTVGGGMLEREIQHIAESVLISGFSDQFYFNLDDEPGGEGSICGGEAVVLVDAEPSAHLEALVNLVNSLAGRMEGFLLTAVSRKNDQGRTIRRHWISNERMEDFPEDADPAFKKLVRTHLSKAVQNGFTEIDLTSLSTHPVQTAYLEHVSPLPKLVIAGGGHVGRALAHLGSLLEFEVTVVDDRPEFVSPDQIPDADHRVVGEAGEVISGLAPGPGTFVVIATRGHSHDGDALKACIGSRASYIGMIGSKRKVAFMKKQFLDEGWATPEQWSAVFSPIGLDLGSKTVQEIAISIAAQLVEVRNRKKETDGG
jgi:xanthine dehydrogenase accessory factor